MAGLFFNDPQIVRKMKVGESQLRQKSRNNQENNNDR